MRYDLSLLKKLSNDDPAFIIDMLETFNRTSPPIIQRMEEYAAKGKYEALGREAHKFIPGVSFLGIKDLEADLVTIEENSKNNAELDKMTERVSVIKQKVNELISIFEADFNLKPQQ